MMTPRIPENLYNRTWFTSDNAYAFLVDAPLTFGHTQLRVAIEGNTPEEVAFAAAAIHIEKCIERFRTTLASLNLSEWADLALYTDTDGKYLKTIILKASANEEQGEYKVHLAPCFSSHVDSANKLFLARLHRAPRNQSGGLLYWVGHREHIVDYDTQPRGDVANARISSFGLTRLAAVLRQPIA